MKFNVLKKGANHKHSIHNNYSRVLVLDEWTIWAKATI